MKKFTITSGNPGPKIMVIGGVHGNEKPGIKIIEEFKDRLKITKGEVVLILANERAIEQGVRYTEKNLNRCFIAGNNGTTCEDQIAREIMSEMDSCDAVLDLHSYTNPQGKPFVICEKEFFPIADKFDVDVISSGWDDTEPGGSEAYPRSIGKIGIGMETGQHDDPKSIERARHAAMTFLKHFDVVNYPGPIKREHRYFDVHTAVMHNEIPFVFDKAYDDFEELEEGSVYAVRGEEKFIAKKGQCIIFPHETGPVGSEAFLIGKAIIK